MPRVATNSLERSLLALDLIEKTPGGMRSADLARVLSIPRSSVSWMMTRLADQGYVTRDAESRKFRLGLKLVGLARGALRELGFRAGAEPVLYRVASQTGLAAGIGVLERWHVLLVDRVEPPAFERTIALDRPRVERDVGRRLPAHSTALGKVLLAGLSRSELDRYTAEYPMERQTDRTVISPDKLMSELRRIRQRGYAIADGEQHLNVRAISAPILNLAGHTHAALSLNGSAAMPAWKDTHMLVETVKKAAEEISVESADHWKQS